MTPTLPLWLAQLLRKYATINYDIYGDLSPEQLLNELDARVDYLTDVCGMSDTEIEQTEEYRDGQTLADYISYQCDMAEDFEPVIDF